MAIIYVDIPLVKGDGGEWNICFHAVNEWPRLLLPRIDNGGLDAVGGISCFRTGGK